MSSPRRVRERALIALGALVLVGGLVGSVIGLGSPAVSTASATVLVASEDSGRVRLLAHPTDFEEQVRQSYAEIATTPIVLRPVIERLQLSTTVARLARSLDVRPVPHQAVLRIDATGRSAPEALRLADAVQQQLVAVATSLTPAAGSEPVAILRPAQRAVVQSGRPPALLGLAGALAGAAVWGSMMIVLLIRRMPRPPRGPSAPSMR